MNLKKLKVPRRMRITSIGPGNKLKGMKVAKGFKSIKKINVAKKFKSSFKKRTSGATADGTVAPAAAAAAAAAGGSGRMGIARPRGSSKWMASVRKKIMRPRFGHHKGKGSSKNIIIIHNNTSIVSNEEDNRASCVDVKDSVTLKEEDVSVTSIDSAAPPPPNEGSSSSKGEETDQEERQDTATMTTTTTTTTTDEEDQEKLLEYQEFEAAEEYHQQQDTRDILTFKEEKASIHIQSVFRGHLARRAFRALKSLVKLQAVVRGVCVRRQARIALLCMNTLVRLQVRVRARQILTRPIDAIHP